MSQNNLMDLLTLDQVSEETGWPLTSIRGWINNGTFCKTARIGRRRYVRRADLDQWVADKFATPESA